ncbi:precorrin-2 dehydrogenase/sirohydrochlorin ferrochelatase family protein [Parasporobacterium paucivorans]|uniref:precorrin-2 dehydrogenase n=1 Tax=Parasporobacterium paucivorans DSM 15970 TaxID=1122934 RepID=A0A1M6DSK8_9FIRM|nr:bifunctional precorrin-2 dehydrogenase/sirohydrochlorin ferrochelatase [Parasporobacterium paucivorans]SHI76119.1 precorrin-2 dehydrogenase / sirohydrochlorin ferrochelatase [Parasporobacterium paucivorans DSM 15970]
MKNEKKRRFPLFIDLADRKVIVIGGGKIAERRIRTLLSFEACIKVIAKECSSDISQMHEAGMIHLEKRAYREGELDDDAVMVLAITDDSRVNESVWSECKRKNIIVNVASNQELCDFFFPAVLLQDEITIGVCGNGTNHSEVREKADLLRKLLKEKTDE